MDTTTTQAEDLARGGHGVWINGWKWDIGWLIGSCAVVPLVLLFVWQGVSADWINVGVTAVVGGPHLFATYTVTYMDPAFRKSHAWVLWAAAIMVPAFVVFLTLTNFQVLLSVFIFAASFHVLHQNAYLTDIYRARAARREAPWSRLIDYGLLMLCIYPIAAYKLVNHSFMLGDVEILMPSFLITPTTYVLVWLGFAFFLAAWMVKTVAEAKQRTLNVPKTILIGVTTLVAFFAPSAADGTRMELAFQAVNAWHSVQYLGMIWLIQKVRKERGLIDSRWIAAISGEGRAAWAFYGVCVAITGVLFAVLLGLNQLDPFHLPFQQYYYMAVLSCLLIHYVLDGYLFAVSTRPAASIEHAPYAAPVAAHG